MEADRALDRHAIGRRVELQRVELDLLDVARDYIHCLEARIRRSPLADDIQRSMCNRRCKGR
jgi:hypothetical protein